MTTPPRIVAGGNRFSSAGPPKSRPRLSAETEGRRDTTGGSNENQKLREGFSSANLKRTCVAHATDRGILSALHKKYVRWLCILWIVVLNFWPSEAHRKLSTVRFRRCQMMAISLSSAFLNRGDVALPSGSDLVNQLHLEYHGPNKRMKRSSDGRLCEHYLYKPSDQLIGLRTVIKSIEGFLNGLRRQHGCVAVHVTAEALEIRLLC